MKVFISADIEGTTFTTRWDETEIGKAGYEKAVAQMTAEVKAACEGAIAAGADYILVNDAHDYGVNIDISQLPQCVEVLRGWSGHPLCMVDGIDESFDAAIFIGYHSAASRSGSPLSHTYSTHTACAKLNGKIVSEFVLYSMACAMMHVPSVFLSGDKMLIDDSQGIHPKLKTLAVKEGLGGSIRCIHPERACRLIKEGVIQALSQDLTNACITLPKHFVLEMNFHRISDAVAKAFYPNCRLENGNTVVFESDDYFEILRAVIFLM